MDKNSEYSSPPEERADPGSEFSAPPAEFGAESGAPPAARSKKHRALLYAGVVLLLSWRLLHPTPTAEVAPAAAILANPSAAVSPPATLAPAAQPTAEATVAPTDKPASSATPAPTAAPTATATPEPVEPEASAVFLSFSDTLEGAITFVGQERITEARADIFDPQIGEVVDSFDIPAEDIALGFYRLPSLDTYAIYRRYRQAYDNAQSYYPDPEIRVTYRVDDEERTLVVPNSYELGFSTRYWGPEEEGDWAFPDCFVLSTYESTEPVDLVYSQDDPAQRGAICFQLTINGQAVPAQAVRLEPREETYGSGDDTWTYYYGRAVVPRPDWAGEHGVAHFTVKEYLRGFDSVWVTERDIEF